MLLEEVGGRFQPVTIRGLDSTEEEEEEWEALVGLLVSTR